MYLEIKQYERNVYKLIEFINNGPYKLEHILSKLNMSRTTFYSKRKNNNFNLEDVKILARMYDDVNATNRLEEAIQEGLDDIANGDYQELGSFLEETRKRYGL